MPSKISYERWDKIVDSSDEEPEPPAQPPPPPPPKPPTPQMPPHPLLTTESRSLPLPEFVGGCRDVDISSFAEGSGTVPDGAAAANWDASFCEAGFARIVGHGVADELVTELRRAAREFFDRPKAEKLLHFRIHAPTTGQWGSYSPLNGTKILNGAHDDPLEGYTFSRPRGGWSELTAEGQESPPAFAAVAARYAAELERVMHMLHRISARALGLPATFFDSPPGLPPSAQLVISHYPPLTSEDVGRREEGKPRYRAHSDYTGFTILLQD